MDSTTHEVVTLLQRERASLTTLLDSLAEAEWERQTLDNETWSVKDTLAHLAGTDRSMGALLRAVLDGTYSLEAARQFNLDEYNARQVGRGRERSVAELRQQLDATREEFLRVVEALSGEAWTVRVWAPGFSGADGREQSLRERMIDYALHDSEHAAHIRSAVGR